MSTIEETIKQALDGVDLPEGSTTIVNHVINCLVEREQGICRQFRYKADLAGLDAHEVAVAFREAGFGMDEVRDTGEVRYEPDELQAAFSELRGLLDTIDLRVAEVKARFDI